MDSMTSSAPTRLGKATTTGNLGEANLSLALSLFLFSRPSVSPLAEGFFVFVTREKELAGLDWSAVGLVGSLFSSRHCSHLVQCLKESRHGCHD